MLPRTKVLLAGAVSIMVVGLFYMWGMRQRSQNLAQGRIESSMTHTTAEEAVLVEPLILLLLDTSASLPRGQTRPGNDPDNREFEATQLLLRLGYHFSSGESGFAPRMGIITFGASPHWLTVDGQRVWQLRTPAPLQKALTELERVMGGAGENDCRRGTYTDFNGAILEAKNALVAGKERISPLVMMMTDGEHRPYPAHPWNYGANRPFDLEKYHKEISAETLRSLKMVESVLPGPLHGLIVNRMASLDYGKEEPVEYISGLPLVDSEVAAQLERDDNRTSFQYAIDAVREVRFKQSEYFDIGLREANRQLLQVNLPELAKRATVQIVGLSADS